MYTLLHKDFCACHFHDHLCSVAASVQQEAHQARCKLYSDARKKVKYAVASKAEACAHRCQKHICTAWASPYVLLKQRKHTHRSDTVNVERSWQLTARRPATVALVPVAAVAPEGPQTWSGEVLPFAIAYKGAKSVMWSLCRCDRNT